MAEHLLKVENLKIGFPVESGPMLPIIKGMDLEIFPGEAVALTGASGCGKSLTAKALCGLLPPAAHSSGKIFWQGTELTGAADSRWADLRGGGMTMIMQEPATGLNPVLQVGKQIAESWALHHPGRKNLAKDESLKLLEEVRIPDPEGVWKQYPHQLSGGMKQRVLLAAALACEPSLLIADEPTTALDPTVQRSILALLMEIRRHRAMAVLFISHDPHLVALITERSWKMEDGRLVNGVFGRGHLDPMDENPDPENPLDPETPFLEARNLVVKYHPQVWGRFHRGNRIVRAVNGVDLVLRPGRAVGLAGESGCGKTTLAQALAGHVRMDSGTLSWGGFEFPGTSGKEFRVRRRMVQLVFQDPVASLNPRQRVRDMLHEAAGSFPHSVSELLAEVDLESDVAQRFSHQLSGGQRQRVALARALAAEPQVLIADEVTGALDPVVTGRILSLIKSIMKQRNLAVLMISHDLDLLRGWCDQVQVMLDGRIMEIFPGTCRDKFLHPYTQDLQASMPAALRADKECLQGEKNFAPTVGVSSGEGCPWAASCRVAISSCHNVLPPLVSVGEGRHSRCPVVGSAGSSTFIDT
jgi:peptide/nickel transport system ATP-binding protein